MPPALADVPQYVPLYDKSSLTFTAVQNNAPVTGGFETFSADIAFASEQLEKSHIKVVVQMDSLTMGDQEILGFLEMPAWFALKAHPQAVYESNSFLALSEKDHYQVNGTLTLKGKSHPVQLVFKLRPLDNGHIVATGETTLMRTMFHVGEGEWSDTGIIRDDVKVTFHIYAQKQ